MRDTEIIEQFRRELGNPIGRHLYAVFGSYSALGRFRQALGQVPGPDGTPFMQPLSVTRGILDSIPDEEFRQLAEREPILPNAAAQRVKRAFEEILRAAVENRDIVVLSELEMVFAYGIDIALLRALATDKKRILLLLPGRRRGDRVVLYPDVEGCDHTLPSTLVSENHLWELDE